MSTSLPRGPRRRTRFSLVLPIALIVLALTIVGVVAAVAYLGDSEVIARATRREGYVSVPIARVTIPAYTKITRDHLFDAVNNRFVTVDVPEDTVLRGGVKARVEDVIGRVVARDKPAGYVFQEQDLLPVGTRPGLVGGIPPGKRALRIDAGHVSGCYGLQRGDGLDLVATYEIDEKALQRAARGSSAPGSVLIDPRWSASPR
ncbi:MAG: hypothetical protein HC882_09085, partial [Acidobacteria bacterium]|nr:hypothetical protein [Acidobacteriota bacterium]